MGRPEADEIRGLAMNMLAGGLSEAGHHEDALIVQEAELAMMRRLGASEETMLVTRSNLAHSYGALGRGEEALRMRQGVYSGRLKLHGEEHEGTLISALNYSAAFGVLKRFEEARPLMRKTIPAARRVLGESHEITLCLRWNYATALYSDPAASLDKLREAVTTLEDVGQIAQQVLGGSHPYTEGIAGDLREARAALRASEEAASGDMSDIRKLVEAMTPGDA